MGNILITWAVRTIPVQLFSCIPSVFALIVACGIMEVIMRGKSKKIKKILAELPENDNVTGNE